MDAFTTTPVTPDDTNAIRALTSLEVVERLAHAARNALAGENAPRLALALLAEITDVTSATTASLVKTQEVSDLIADKARPRYRTHRDQASLAAHDRQ